MLYYKSNATNNSNILFQRIAQLLIIWFSHLAYILGFDYVKDFNMIDTSSPIYPMVNNLFEEDCLDCMKRIPDESIDMILCDLPYGITQNPVGLLYST